MINKSILLATITAGSICGNAGLSTIATTQTTINPVNSVDEDQPEACTVMYVGKQVAADGMSMICRSADAGPRAMNLNFKVVEHNELANKTIKSLKGFEWKMPSTTYRYICTPKNLDVHSGLHWEVSGTNEMGVNVTATLTTYASDDALKYDDHVSTGIGEDNLTQVVAATAATAREGIETVANIIKNQGAEDANTILVQDKNESWLMEIYTGHHYCAIKLPETVACTIGNECMLNSIGELKEKYGLKDGDYIVSDKALQFPNAKFTDDAHHDLDHLDLFRTFARPLTGVDSKGDFFETDNCHMRTWRGFNMFAKNQFDEHPEYKKYFYETDRTKRIKYTPFFVPDDKLGINDVISYMRDRFDNILNPEEKDVNYGDFEPLAEQNKLRWVGVDYAYQVHIMRVNPNLPREYSAEEWMCLSNANHAPFFPISNGINRMNDYYTHVTPYYGYDDQSAICIFKQLNALADTDREYYGLPVQHLFEEQETIWQKQYADVIGQVKDKSVNDARDIITNYSLYIQKVALAASKLLHNELSWHIMNTSRQAEGPAKLFKPLMDIEYYGWIYGWDYKRDGTQVKLTQGNEEIDIDLTYLADKKGTIKKGDKEQSVNVAIMDDVPYIDYVAAKDFISQGKDIAKIDIKEFTSPNNLVWIIPVSIIVPLVVTAGVLVPVLVIRKKKKKPTVLVAN